MKRLLVVCALTLTTMRAQTQKDGHQTLEYNGIPINISEATSSGPIKLIEATSQTAMLLDPKGDFILFDAEGKEILRLKRDRRGDPIHERFATLLLLIGSKLWSLKDWRDYQP